jgi:hypothetical protein
VGVQVVKDIGCEPGFKASTGITGRCQAKHGRAHDMASSPSSFRDCWILDKSAAKLVVMWWCFKVGESQAFQVLSPAAGFQ